MARRSGIRASDADRDGVVDRLRHAAAEGRLASHELEQRVTSALKATTYGELDATVSDLPSVERERRPRSTSGRAVATVQAHPALILVAIPVVLIVVATLVLMTVLWAAVMCLALCLGHNRRVMMYHRAPWLYGSRHHRRIQASRSNAVGGFTPWL